MKVVAVWNVKGGVGKTETVLQLGRLLAAHYRVVLLDNDPAGSLSRTVLGAAVTDKMTGLYEGALTLHQASTSTPFGTRLRLVPSTVDLDSMIFRLERQRTDAARLGALHLALQRSAGYCDVVLIDHGPGISYLSLNGLRAADLLLVPLRPEPNDVRGLVDVLAVVQELAGAGIKVPDPYLLMTMREQSARHRVGSHILVASGMVPQCCAGDPLAGEFQAVLNGMALPLVLGSIPMANGRDRTRRLAAAYATVADALDPLVDEDGWFVGEWGKHETDAV